MTAETIRNGGSEKRWPCSLNETGTVLPCWALEVVMEDNHGRGSKAQGVKYIPLINLNTMKSSGSIVVIKSGDHSKKGVTLNFCPFCSGWLRKDKPESVFRAEALAAQEGGEHG